MLVTLIPAANPTSASTATTLPIPIATVDVSGTVGTITEYTHTMAYCDTIGVEAIELQIPWEIEVSTPSYVETVQISATGTRWEGYSYQTQPIEITQATDSYSTTISDPINDNGVLSLDIPIHEEHPTYIVTTSVAVEDANGDWVNDTAAALVMLSCNNELSNLVDAVAPATPGVMLKCTPITATGHTTQTYSASNSKSVLFGAYGVNQNTCKMLRPAIDEPTYYTLKSRFGPQNITEGTSVIRECAGIPLPPPPPQVSPIWNIWPLQCIEGSLEAIVANTTNCDDPGDNRYWCWQFTCVWQAETTWGQILPGTPWFDYHCRHGSPDPCYADALGPIHQQCTRLQINRVNHERQKMIECISFWGNSTSPSWGNVYSASVSPPGCIETQENNLPVAVVVMN